MASKNKIESGIERLVAQQLAVKVKEYKKKHLHYISFFKWVNSPDFLALVTLHHYRHILKIKKQFPKLNTDLIFAMQYLYKVTYATKPELRFMMDRSLTECGRQTNYRYLVQRGLIVRDVNITPGGWYEKDGEKITYKEKRRDIFVITDEGRKFVEELGCKGIVRDMFNNWKVMNAGKQKVIFRHKKANVLKNPEKFKR